jgi:rod shape-determining protein MreD
MDDRTPGIRPRQSLWRRLDLAARHGFPALSTIVLLLVATAPLGLPGQAQLQQALTLCAVYFWSLFRPVAMSAPVVFVIGMLADLLGLEPVGVSVFVLLAAHGMALRWRRPLVRQQDGERQGLLAMWAAFVPVALFAAAATWALTSLILFTLLPPAPVLFQFVLSVALYPAFSGLFTYAHRGVANPESA